MNCIIVDDEPLARKGLEMSIATIASLNLLASLNNSFAANDFLKSNKVDLMFLDINMPELDGINFLKSLRDAPMVIFTTAYPQYALESYELDAIDYLVKPIRIERFIKAVNKAEGHLQLLEQTGNRHEVEQIEDEYIFVRSERKFVKIFFKEILYIEGLKDYVILHTKGSKIFASMNVKTICAKLPVKMFARISKSFIINIHQATSFDSEFVYIGETDIPIGQAFRDDFMRDYVNGHLLRR